MKSIFLLVYFCFFLYSCAETESENVKSSGINAKIDVVAEGDGYTNILVDLEVGSGINATDIDLSNSDQLFAFVGEVSKKLTKDESIFDIVYVTTFPFDDLDSVFKISLFRENDESAPDSFVQLPQPFKLLPLDEEEYARNQIINFKWNNSVQSEQMRIVFKSQCFDENQETSHSRFTQKSTLDNGSFSVNAQTLLGESEPDFDTSGGCKVSAEFNRIKQGQLDPAYGEGGYIRATQLRTILFSIAAKS